ncbi:MAG: hypothetical protein ACLPGW_16745 [Roseiarcus sp.]
MQKTGARRGGGRSKIPFSGRARLCRSRAPGWREQAFPSLSKEIQAFSKEIPNFSKLFQGFPNKFFGGFQRNQGLGGGHGDFAVLEASEPQFCSRRRRAGRCATPRGRSICNMIFGFPEESVATVLRTFVRRARWGGRSISATAVASQI